MPHQECHRTSSGRPRGSEGCGLLRIGTSRQALQPLQAGTHAKVIDRPDIGTAQGKQQHHLGAPHAEALQCRQCGDDLFVRPLVQRFRIESTGLDRFSQTARIADLLA